VLNWLRNVIKCALNYIPEPIKHTKTSVFCYAVTFRSGIGLGSAIVCHDKAFVDQLQGLIFYVLPPLDCTGCFTELHTPGSHSACVIRTILGVNSLNQ